MSNTQDTEPQLDPADTPNEVEATREAEVTEKAAATPEADALPCRGEAAAWSQSTEVAASELEEQADEPEDYELPISEEDLALRVEAAVLTSDRALTAGKLGKLLGDIPTRYIHAADEALNEHYADTCRSFRIEKVAGGYRVMTLPAYVDVLRPVHRARVQAKLSPAAMETLAIVAYKQPVIRAEIEAIRGVASGEVLRALMERHMVKVVGRAEEIGRPMLYGTTKAFLEAFGLADLKDLPKVEQLKPGG